jgi:tetratricopeptide (TPR) repeat protein
LQGELEAAAERALVRSAESAAARLFERAAALTPAGGPVARRLLRAWSSAKRAGSPDAGRFLGAALEVVVDPRERAQIQLLRAELRFGEAGCELMLAEAARVEPVDSALASLMVRGAAAMMADRAAFVDLARRALARAPREGAEAELQARLIYGLALQRLGRFDEADEHLSRADGILQEHAKRRARAILERAPDLAREQADRQEGGRKGRASAGSGQLRDTLPEPQPESTRA